MKNGGSGSRELLERDYQRRLASFVEGAGEAALVEAYELGRRGMGMGLNLLEFAMLHHRAADTLSNQGFRLSWTSAAEFFAEALSPYELTLRAYSENTRLLGLGANTSGPNDHLERAHKQLRTILDATTAVIHLRGEDGRFLFVNHRFEQVFGVERARVLDDQQELPHSIATTLSSGDARAMRHRSPLQIEETFVLQQEEFVYLSLKVPLLDDRGEPYAVCSVATDISERKRAEEAIQRAKEEAELANRALRATQAQLVQSAKMASLGELVAGIAHEINNPLGFASSHVSTVQKRLGRLQSELGDQIELDEHASFRVAKERLRELGLGLQRIADLVQQLRTFSRLDEGERKLVNVRESIDSVVTILRHRMSRRIKLRIGVANDETLLCYPNLLNQALLNLLANAIEAIPNEGSVTIETRSGEQSYDILVSDTGSGITPEHLDRIFDPFFTTKPVGEGTGLGLSITYSIMQKHGGALRVMCPDSGGTVMTLCFPSTEFPPPGPRSDLSTPT